MKVFLAFLIEAVEATIAGVVFFAVCALLSIWGVSFYINREQDVIDGKRKSFWGAKKI